MVKKNRLSHSQPFANTHFHFFVLLGSATSTLSSSGPNKRQSDQGIPDLWAGLDVPQAASNWRCVGVAVPCLKATPRDTYPVSCYELHHIVAVGIRALLPRDMNSVQTARTASKKTYTVETHFELVGSRKSSTTACSVWGVKTCAHTSSPVTVDSSNFISFLHTSWYPGLTLRGIPVLRGQFFAQSSDRHLQCRGYISSVFQNQFLHSCCVNTRPRCATPTACPFDHFRTVCNTFLHNALSLCHHSTPSSRKHVSYYEILRGTMFPMLQLHINLSHEQTLTLTPSVACYP